jgi:ribosomal protein S18 acetylase RimI-like enzyme
VNAENDAARTLYKQFGFSVVGRRRGYYRTPGGVQDALIMRLPLR